MAKAKQIVAYVDDFTHDELFAIQRMMNLKRKTSISEVAGLLLKQAIRERNRKKRESKKVHS